MLSRLRLGTAVFAVASLSWAFAHADNWSRFRGPNGSGVSDDANIPVKFSDKENLAWKVAIVGVGEGSPVVWNDRILLQNSSADGSKRSVQCRNFKDGELVWESAIDAVRAKTHPKNSMASQTPATDGKAVYAAMWDGKHVFLNAYSFEKGEKLWSHDLGAWESQHGPGSSPIVYKDAVYFSFDMDAKSATLYAFEAKTGKKLWTAPREGYRACYAAPIILESKSGPQLIVTSTTAVTSYDLDSGSTNWNWTWTHTSKQPLRAVAGSLLVGDTVISFTGDGGGDRHTVALKLPDATGARPTIAWEMRKDLPYVPGPLAKDGHLFFVADKGFAGCYNAKTGSKDWYERVPEANFTASPVMARDRIYAPSEEGDVYVFKADASKFQQLAKNHVGERIRATPAVANGKLLIRGQNHLFCFGK
ncbi:MAG: PQQ-binding-like beta-propeller repeat protein [Gemmataceae bacterium]|nr:PQQ-binding-like beta-propeller repeat protein [Gemmataceae bacterium]